ncbi:MAG: 4Fe-4S dicluster domain-containing protein [Candidatus Latescibacteria bacterium]|nr:4Fe-4S dicluster domain-containing protein [Candidatus Latescibacterota bacterium]NIM22009.1 4Fe-4S dicluster domain-containing protein [Candidatus Latescibacterota bacterium]NIM66027.1 4Fe-4S dicluster domain-containing protein [Candidatus Latescibacterota bacterium]NIO02435.1 4Fe-4S dicluster domain-containing protein [Candidatus Latescibacterota bacterium]NIO29346.1 4Fe-4S dicluster domain-containing protein [Candidatus Latescibacterota bacterium]
MGHAVNPDREYRLLQKRLDSHIAGAPETPEFMKILRLLFSPTEAELARRIPFRLTPLHVLSEKLGIPEEKLNDKMNEMGERGLVLDSEHDGIRYIALAPVVIGFYEFTFMRTREDMPMAELSRLFDTYMNADDRFARSAFKGQTQLARSLVREEALPEGDHTEILDWERASRIVRSATAVGVSLCACRHKASHLGKACENTLQNCLSFNSAAKMLFRSGLAQPVTKDEAMRILERSKEAGLAQTGDNVQKKVTYICNCCSCCCGFMHAIKTFDLRNAVVTSNWIAQVDTANCTGCGKCAESCPVDAIDLMELKIGKKKRRQAVRDNELCLGCGVCYSACENGGISMKPRERKAVVPETVYDRTVMMAIERGKLRDLIFDCPEKLSHRAIGRMIGVLEKSPPAKVAMAIKPLRSAFLNAVVMRAKRESRSRYGKDFG